MTTSGALLRRTGALVSGLAIAGTALAGCSSSSPKEEMGSPVTTTVNPLGGNSFVPSVVAPGPQTALPGNVITGG
jgi:hypothetical protein